MNKKSFFLGILTGIILTLAILFVIGLVKKNSADDDSVQLLEKPVSYENKKETSFKVFQLCLSPNRQFCFDHRYHGNTVVILGENYYSDQVVKMKNPQRVGTYSYTNKGGIPMTVPVLEGEIEEIVSDDD